MNRTLVKTLTFAVAAAPLCASAHVAADGIAHHGFMQGFLHPFTGLDHLLAMLVVGVWSAISLRRPWVAPTAFASMVLVGALVTVAGLSLPLIEPVVAASVLLLGIALAWRLTLPAGAVAVVCGTLALFHGAAHGNEIQGAAALAGMVIATAVLHGVGLAAGTFMANKTAWWSRAAGLGTGVVGMALLAGAL